MKKKLSYTRNTILLLIAGLLILSSCARKISGAYILSLKEIKGHEVASIDVTFYNSKERMDSTSISLSSKQESDQAFIQTFKDILKESDAISDEEVQNFSPPSESSHRIVVTFDNNFVLEFYYSNDNNWLIWSNTQEREGNKILQYYFLSPPSSIEDWLSSIEEQA